MIAIIYVIFTVVLCVIYGYKIENLTKHVQLMEDYLLGEVEENEVDD